jgi:hypothetical protein
MKTIVLACMVLLTGFSTKILAQGIYLQDVNGSPVRIGTYTNVSGSPYLSENWLKANIKMANGKLFNNVDVKYDQVADQLIYKGVDGQAMNFIDKITEYHILGDDGNSNIYRNGFSPAKGLTSDNYAQVLVDGKNKLLKRTTKRVQESREYNSATVDRSILSTTLYYLVNEKGELINISKDKKSILKAFSVKSIELEQYITANRLNVKDDLDMVKLITYYNTL